MMLTDDANACDRCGAQFLINDVDALTGTVEGHVRDYCPTCTLAMGVTICGGPCGELMGWDDLNADYLCCVCEPRIDAVVARSWRDLAENGPDLEGRD